ncbi:hypothetical protein LPJ59_004390 [Coemansia sp. RSA 2399]|nr:hypothetical protein LPJ59_004390 [Coemansia sp. RSA 2399]KAJ1899477.1 hypothetical protein LPJ81_004135 [Coemansia sp. IMI 209127]
MKFAPTLLIASVLGVAFASAQPIVDQELDRRDLVIATVYETVAPQVVKAAENPAVVVVTVTETANGTPAAATSSAPASSPTYVPAVSEVAFSAPAPMAHSPQQSTSSAVAATTSSSAVAVATQASSSPSSDSSSDSSSSSDWLNTMLSSLNSIRALAGKSPVTLNSELSTIAQAHSAYQASVNTMTHSDPSGELGSRLSADSISWTAAAENIAWNQQDVASVMLAWTNSPGHYANMIGDYTEVGFGVSDLYWTQDFINP